MDKTTTLSLQLAKQLVSCPPKTEEEKDALRHTLQQIEKLTAVGVKHFTRHWSEWNLGCALPFTGVKEIDSASLKALFKSGCFFHIGLPQLGVEQAELLASLTTDCGVNSFVGLPKLRTLPYKIAKILVLQGQSSYKVSGNAEIDEKTLTLLLSPENDERVRIDELSVALASCLRNLPAECSLSNIFYSFTNDEVSHHLSESVPWFNEEKYYYASSISASEGHCRLLRRIGATTPCLSLKVSNHFDPEVLRALLGHDSIVESLDLTLHKVSRELAEALLRIEHRPKELNIDAAEALSNETARILAKYEGTLKLQLREISVEVAEILVAARKLDPDAMWGSARRNVNIAVKNLKGLESPLGRQISDDEVVEFEELRRSLSQILPLDRLPKKDRFISRLRRSKSEIAEVLAAVNEVCDDGDAALISAFLEKPPTWDRNISVKLADLPIPEEFRGFASECGCVVMGPYSSEDDLYEFVSSEGGQLYIDDLFAWYAEQASNASVKFDWSLSRHIVEAGDGTVEIVICAGQVRILACTPEHGSKWLDYEVIPREICDFLNVILFGRGYLAMYVEVQEYYGFFIVMRREEVLNVLGELKKHFELEQPQSDRS